MAIPPSPADLALIQSFLPPYSTPTISLDEVPPIGSGSVNIPKTVVPPLPDMTQFVAALQPLMVLAAFQTICEIVPLPPGVSIPGCPLGSKGNPGTDGPGGGNGPTLVEYAVFLNKEDGPASTPYDACQYAYNSDSDLEIFQLEDTFMVYRNVDDNKLYYDKDGTTPLLYPGYFYGWSYEEAYSIGYFYYDGENLQAQATSCVGVTQ